MLLRTFLCDKGDEFGCGLNDCRLGFLGDLDPRRKRSLHDAHNVGFWKQPVLLALRVYGNRDYWRQRAIGRIS